MFCIRQSFKALPKTFFLQCSNFSNTPIESALVLLQNKPNAITKYKNQNNISNLKTRMAKLEHPITKEKTTGNNSTPNNDLKHCMPWHTRNPLKKNLYNPSINEKNAQNPAAKGDKKNG